ncbi:hypothetical protein D3C77_586620 [compost metagenome]
MGHGHQADAQVRVGVHRQAEAEGVAHPRQRLGIAQAAPIVVVGKNDLHAVQRDATTELVEVGDHHVGGQRQAGALVQFGHAVEAGGRVFVVLQVIAQ